MAKIAEEKPDVLLLSGDVPLTAGWPTIGRCIAGDGGLAAGGLKVFPAMGNHELKGTGGLENWWNNFPELKGRRWYSVQLGPVYVITVDSNLDLTPGSEQSAMGRQATGGLPKGTRYVFVSLHHPPDGGPDRGRPLAQCASQRGRAGPPAGGRGPHLKASIVVIAGHIHAYQRFQRNGVIYLVSGGGGARPYPIARTPADLYQDNVFPNFHYVKFVSAGGELKATVYRLDDKGGFVPSDSFTVGGSRQGSRKVKSRRVT